MIITAKYASTCPCCSVRIVPGTPVEWSKGSPARHVGCKGGAVTMSTPRPAYRSSAPRGRRTGCYCGSIEDHPRKSDCASCRFDHYDC